MGIEAFRIGITVSLINHASHGLNMLAQHFGQTEAAALRLQNRMREMQVMAMGGAMLLGVSFAGVKIGESLYKAGEKYAQAKAQFDQLNAGSKTGQVDEFRKDADKFARSTEIIGTSSSKLMNTLSNMHTALGDYESAKLVSPVIASMEFANKAIYGEGAKFNDTSSMSLAKIIEQRGGVKSPEDMKRQADYMQHVISGTRNVVGPDDVRAFQKTAGIAGRVMTDPVFYYEMERLIQEQGGSTAGGGIMSAYQNLQMGRTTERAAQVMQKYGLLHGDAPFALMSEAEKLKMFADKSLSKEDRLELVDLNKKGKLAHINPGAFTGQEYANDPVQLLEKVILPALAAHDKTTVDKLDPTRIAQFLNTILTNRRAAATYALIAAQLAQFHKSMDINANAAGIDQSIDQAKTLPQGQELRFAAAWERLKENLGIYILPFITPIIEKLSDAIVYLGTAAANNPEISTGILALAAAFTVLAGVGGAMLLARAAWIGFAMFAGPVLRLPLMLAARGFGAILGPLGRLASFVFSPIVDGLGSLLSPLARLAGIAWAGIARGLGMILAPLTAVTLPLALKGDTGPVDHAATIGVNDPEHDKWGRATNLRNYHPMVIGPDGHPVPTESWTKHVIGPDGHYLPMSDPVWGAGSTPSSSSSLAGLINSIESVFGTAKERGMAKDAEMAALRAATAAGVRDGLSGVRFQIDKDGLMSALLNGLEKRGSGPPTTGSSPTGRLMPFYPTRNGGPH